MKAHAYVVSLKVFLLHVLRCLLNHLLGHFLLLVAIDEQWRAGLFLDMC
jgi:hypothetical protein